jgi:hypothetical protein
MLNAVTTKKQQDTKRQNESVGGDGCVYYLDCNDSNTNISICSKSPNCIP